MPVKNLAVKNMEGENKTLKYGGLETILKDIPYLLPEEERIYLVSTIDEKNRFKKWLPQV